MTYFHHCWSGCLCYTNHVVLTQTESSKNLQPWNYHVISHNDHSSQMTICMSYKHSSMKNIAACYQVVGEVVGVAVVLADNVTGVLASGWLRVGVARLLLVVVLEEARQPRDEDGVSFSRKRQPAVNLPTETHTRAVIIDCQKC